MEILTLFQSLPIKRFTRGLAIQRAAFSDQKDIDSWWVLYIYSLWFHPPSWAKFHSCPQRIDFISRMMTAAAGTPRPPLSGVVKSKCAAVWNGRSVTRLSKSKNKKPLDFTKRRCEKVPSGNVLTVISQAKTRMMFLFRSLERDEGREKTQPPRSQIKGKEMFVSCQSGNMSCLNFQLYCAAILLLIMHKVFIIHTAYLAICLLPSRKTTDVKLPAKKHKEYTHTHTHNQDRLVTKTIRERM